MTKPTGAQGFLDVACMISPLGAQSKQQGWIEKLEGGAREPQHRGEEFSTMLGEELTLELTFENEKEPARGRECPCGWKSWGQGVEKRAGAAPRRPCGKELGFSLSVVKVNG